MAQLDPRLLPMSVGEIEFLAYAWDDDKKVGPVMVHASVTIHSISNKSDLQ